jgi:(p)ppGpp synthase/HD superfamily hydrolase
MPRVRLGGRFVDATAWVADLHARQARKGTHIPYVSHLLSVAALVLEDGGDETEAIAALLHDAVEDQGGAPVLEEIRARFGDEVAAIVASCTDTDQTPKPPWLERKMAYLSHLEDPSLTDAVLRVSCADKLHNARSIVVDVRQSGPVAWSRFNAGPEDVLWYYRSLADLFARRIPSSRSARELVRVVDELAGTVPDASVVHPA